jgi:alpha-beta hydrolase superfamily lysophospholipase
MQMVHKGSLEAWRSVQQATEKVLRDATAVLSGDESCKTYFVGHSFGGALATLAAASAVAQGCAATSYYISVGLVNLIPQTCCAVITAGFSF